MLRFFMFHPMDESCATGAPPSPELMAKMGALVGDMQKAGILVDTAGLKPSAMNAARLRYRGGKFTVTDGPFAEAKELLAGYAIIDVASKDEALGWCKRFCEIVGDVDCEIREMWRPDEVPHT